MWFVRRSDHGCQWKSIYSVKKPAAQSVSCVSCRTRRDPIVKEKKYVAMFCNAEYSKLLLVCAQNTICSHIFCNLCTDFGGGLKVRYFNHFQSETIKILTVFNSMTLLTVYLFICFGWFFWNCNMSIHVVGPFSVHRVAPLDLVSMSVSVLLIWKGKI